MGSRSMTPRTTPESESPAVVLTLVITLRNGVQVRAGVKDAEVKRDSATGKLTGLDWTLDGDPYGTSIAWVDLSEIVAVHFERAPRTPDSILTQP